MDSSKRMHDALASGQFEQSMAKLFGDPAMMGTLLSVLEPGSVCAGGSGSSAGPEAAAGGGDVSRRDAPQAGPDEDRHLMRAHTQYAPGSG